MFVWYVFYYWASKRNNDFGGWWMYIVLLLGVCPGWMLVSRWSKNLVLDGVLYDAVMASAFFLTMYVVGAAAHFNWIQWVGALSCGVGLVMLRFGA